MKYEVKRISVWSAVKITFFLSLVLGFLLGIFYALLLIPIAMLPMDAGYGEFGSEFPVAIGTGLIVLMPIICAIFMTIGNTIGVVIATWLYNLIARLAGGLEYDLVEVKSAVVQPVSQTPPPTATGGTI